MSYTGKVQNGVVVLPPEAHLPEGTEVEINPVAAASDAVDFTTELLRIARKVRNLPADLARNHDHYLHGQARK